MNVLRLGTRRLRRPSLLVSVALLSAIPVLLLGTALAVGLHRIVEHRDLESTRTQAIYTAKIGIGAYFGGQGTTPGRVLSLQRQLADLRRQGQVSGVAFWTPRGTFRWGTAPVDPANLTRARAGATTSEVVDDQLVVHVPVPLSSAPGAHENGVLVLAIPYGLVRAEVAHDTRILYLIVLGGVALLYAFLFPILARASRRLRRTAEENERLARHDVLTGLPNRMRFQELLDGSDRTRTAAIVVDLDRFKEVNDAHGHHVGDELLVCVGRRLRAAVREADVVARMGGDEFAILCPGADEQTLELLSARIVAAVAEPVAIEGVRVGVNASVGASMPAASADADELVRLADAAMYAAKDAGGGVHRLQALRAA